MPNVRLTSVPMVHTPGLFRWMQNGYKGTRAAKTSMLNVLCEGFGIGRETARGLLSGKIPVVIDDEAGTVEFVAKDPTR